MNTGISLRKPGETTYGRYRRLVLANPSSSLSSFKKLTALDISYAEKKFCEKHAINYVEPSNSVRLLKPFAIRACDYCFLSGHHSKYFACRWLDICPVHDRKITLFCSGCGKNWPSEAEIMKRQCGICGRKVCLNDLKSFGAFNIELFREKVGPLIKLEEIFNASQFMDLYSSFGSEETSNWRRSDTFISSTLPSTILGLFPHVKSIFNSLKISNFNLSQVVSFDLEDNPPSMLAWSKQVGGVVENTIDSLSQKILSWLSKRNKSIDVINTRDLHRGVPYLLTQYPPDLITYSVWRIIIDPNLKASFKRHALNNIYQGRYHLAPTPMTVCGPQHMPNHQVGNAKYSYFNPWSDCHSIVLPPLGLIDMVYKMDAMDCFKRISKFIVEYTTNENMETKNSREKEDCYSGSMLLMLNLTKNVLHLSFIPSEL
jgi:hypothetical protein